MKPVCPLLFFLLGAWITLTAQSPLPQPYEIKSDTVTSEKLDSLSWQKLEDKEGKWTINDVRSWPLSGKFHTDGIKADGFDTKGIHTYWHRYRLKNTLPREAKISLTSMVDFFDVFVIKSDSTIVHYRSGRLQKWEQKDGLKSATWAGAVPLVLLPGEEVTIYDRRNRKRETDFNTAVRFMSTEKLIHDHYVNYVDERIYYFARWHLQEAFIIGLIFLSIFISLFFYRVVKEKVYIYFALFAFFLGINRHYNIIASYTEWYRQDWSQYVNYLGFAWNFIPFFLIQFIRHFFSIKQKYPKWDRFLFWMGVLNMTVGVGVMILYIMNLTKITGIYRLSNLVSFGLIPIGLIITSLLYIRHSNRSYRYLAFGAIPLMLLYLLSIFAQERALFSGAVASAFKFLSGNFRLIEMIFLAWLILCFMWVLVMRFDKLRKENAQQALDKERLAKEKEMERNELIAKQKSQLEQEVAERTADLKKSLDELKATQSQLIQSEKMASLGELTAGIAHEIQNPLNFVNNFSEVSKELLDEMKIELNSGNMEDAKQIAEDVIQNLEKINHHGKRADAIVKGMLQHSRSSGGQKELADINALCEEYLRLSYHGLRAKDKSFNATIKTDFDNSIGSINIIPQDIGRVILNLLTNAFYVVNEKKQQQTGGYEPTITVSTKKINGKVEIRVTDNGNGIPQKVLDKIFQPFFTTKPTGQGTGLGLSLSYDIIKAHGGEIKVNTKENEGTEFTIILPA